MRINNKLFKSYTILYAEDEGEVRKDYANYFNLYFKTVYEAANGLEAYKLYQRHLPDILLLDTSMAEIDGLTLAEMIRKEDDYVKIVILAADADQDKLLKAVRLRLVDYIIKPISRTKLLDVFVEAILNDEKQKSAKRQIDMIDNYYWRIDSMELFANDTKVHLTKKEVLLLFLLFSNTTLFFSIDDIIDYYASQGVAMTQSAVQNVIKRLKVKLPKKSIINEFGIGYKILSKSR